MSLDRRHVPVVWQHVTEPARSHFLNVTQEEIGLLPGISRQVANEALKTLGARGHIKAARTGITVCALEGLLRQGGWKLRYRRSPAFSPQPGPGRSSRDLWDLRSLVL